LVVLCGARRLLAGGPKHPPLFLHQLGDVAQALNESLLEARVGEEARNADIVDVLAAGTLEYQREARPAMLRRKPVGDPGGAGLRLQKLIRALSDAQSRQRFLRFLDQRAVQGEQRLSAVLEIEHRDDMVLDTR